MKNLKINKFDVIIIGAGISGMYQLYKLREMGFSVCAIEAASDIGGTWYWNRYPGCCFDSESYTYNYSWDKELLQEWDWKHEFAFQPETLRYLSYVADKHDLRKEIQFDRRVKKARYDELSNTWTVELDTGEIAKSTFLITAIGALSIPQMPKIEGIGSFNGGEYHTALWPRDPDGYGGSINDFERMRVAVIGTGSSGVQIAQEIAKTADHLYVFQRTPNWCAPLGNKPINKTRMKEIKGRFEEIFKRCKETSGGFLYNALERNAVDATEEDRTELFEKLYNESGFGIWIGNYQDILTDHEANAYISDFVGQKIRARVNDPAIAEKLIPKNHGFGTRRIPMETNYYEIYNQSNVTLVDLLETPIERIVPSGIATIDEHYEVDLIVYATGFDAIRGALDRIEFQGLNGANLKEKWVDGPKTMLGLQSVGFPNLFTLVGPHNGASFCNIPRCSEQNVEWVSQLLGYMRNKGLNYIEPKKASEIEWTDHVYETASETLFVEADGWFMGANTNIAPRKRAFLVYAGGQTTFNDKCDEQSANGYPGFNLCRRENILQ